MEQNKKHMPRDKWILIYFGCSWIKDAMVRLLGQQGVPSWTRATKLFKIYRGISSRPEGHKGEKEELLIVSEDMSIAQVISSQTAIFAG